MSDKKKIIAGLIIPTVLLGFAAIVVFAIPNAQGQTLFKKWKSKKSGTDTSPQPVNEKIDNGSSDSGRSDNYPLAYGSYGYNVKILQAYLNLYKGAALKTPIDGDFGTNTQKALQKAFGKTTFTQTDYNTFIKPTLATVENYIKNPKGNSNYSSDTTMQDKPEIDHPIYDYSLWVKNMQTVGADRIIQLYNVYSKTGNAGNTVYTIQDKFAKAAPGAILGKVYGILGNYAIIYMKDQNKWLAAEKNKLYEA